MMNLSTELCGVLPNGRYANCGLETRGFQNVNPFVIKAATKQHLVHHEDNHATTFSTYTIRVDDDSGYASCDDFCIGNDGKDSLEYLYSELSKNTRICYTLFDNPLFRQMQCGLTLKRFNRSMNIDFLHKAHMKHHEEGHIIPVINVTAQPRYLINQDGCTCEESETEDRAYTNIGLLECKAIKLGVVTQYNCGMVAPSLVSKWTHEQLYKIHNTHHRLSHTPKTIIIPNLVFDRCICDEEDKLVVTTPTSSNAKVRQLIL